MDNTTQKPEHTLPGLIRKVLGSPHSEQVIKSQIIQLAAQHLHVPEVTTALLEVLPLTKDRETRDRLVQFLSGLNTSRFTDTGALFNALLQVFRQEKDRDTRTFLLYRLQESLHQDERLAGFFIELGAEPSLSEQERLAVQEAIASLPSIPEETALAALLKNTHAPTILQQQALDLAERCTVWSDKMVAALQPYLDVKNDRAVRFRVLSKLADARLLNSGYAPLLTGVLRTDNDVYARAIALDALSRIKPWDETILIQLYWTATNDGDEQVRQAALRLQQEAPELSDEQMVKLAGLLASEHTAGVRLTLLELLKPVMRLPEIRQAAAAAFAGNPGVFDDTEFNTLTSLLAPYAGRDEQIGQLLLNSTRQLPNTAQRQKVLGLVLGKVKIETVLDTVVQLFSKERNEVLRETLFNQIKALSVTRHPQLVDVFCTELEEPGSPFRMTCAGILANASETYPRIVQALEDVLQYDNDRELVRLCLDGYLLPGVEKKFSVLLAVVKNELLDTLSRQKALDAILKLSLHTDEQEALATALSGLQPGTLRTEK